MSEKEAKNNKKAPVNDEIEMKKKQIIIPKDWDAKIRSLVGRNTSGYILNAIKIAMRKDKLL